MTERRARRHLGSSSDPEYTLGEGQEEHHYWCPANKRYRVEDGMTWYVSRVSTSGFDNCCAMSAYLKLN